MDADKSWKEALLLVSSPDGEKQPAPAVVSKEEDKIPYACTWALSFAFSFGILRAYKIFGPQTSCDQCLASKWCYLLTDAAADESRALEHGQLWCSALQAAAAVLALLLLTSRRLRALAFAFAFAALTATTAGHCMLLGAQWLLLAAYPGDLPITINILLILIILGMDLLRFRRLVRGWDEEQKQK